MRNRCTYHIGFVIAMAFIVIAIILILLHLTCVCTRDGEIIVYLVAIANAILLYLTLNTQNYSSIIIIGVCAIIGPIRL